MTPERLDQLLYESEGEALDFKEDQYAFEGATPDDKSEILKDILGFANAWRRSEAYILIGVREVRGGKSLVVGCQRHLPEHSLQQFVNSKTNRAVRFSYHTMELEGQQVGVITIDQQARPFWLNKDYGRLKKDEVYVRRGSSTDPRSPVSPDEIIRMKEASEPKTASLGVQFRDPQTGTLQGASRIIEADFMRFPPGDGLPDLADPQGHGFSVDFRRANRNYYREAAIYFHRNCNFHPAQLAITNTGEVSAEDVRIESLIEMTPGLEVLPDTKIKGRSPIKYCDHLFGLSGPREDVFNGLHSALDQDGSVRISIDAHSQIIESEFSRIQPGRMVLTDVFHISKQESGPVIMNGKVFARNLPQPMCFALALEFKVTLEDIGKDKFLDWVDNPGISEGE